MVKPEFLRTDGHVDGSDPDDVRAVTKNQAVQSEDASDRFSGRKQARPLGESAEDRHDSEGFSARFASAFRPGGDILPV
jgi:hypothetical protein